MTRATLFAAVIAAAALLTASGLAVARAESDGSALAPTPLPPSQRQPLAAYSARLTQVCSGAMLFNGTHSIGTRAGAIAVAQDIRRSGAKRLRSADVVPKPRRASQLAKRWIRLERRLIELYASDYLRIWYAIEGAQTPKQRAQLPAVLRRLIDQPHRFERQAAKLETALHLPDCTGGSGLAGGPAASTVTPPA